MKKVFFLIIILTVILVGCNTQNTTPHPINKYCKSPTKLNITSVDNTEIRFSLSLSDVKWVDKMMEWTDLYEQVHITPSLIDDLPSYYNHIFVKPLDYDVGVINYEVGCDETKHIILDLKKYPKYKEVCNWDYLDVIIVNKLVPSECYDIVNQSFKKIDFYREEILRTLELYNSSEWWGSDTLYDYILKKENIGCGRVNTIFKEKIICKIKNNICMIIIRDICFMITLGEKQ